MSFDILFFQFILVKPVCVSKDVGYDTLKANFSPNKARNQRWAIYIKMTSMVTAFQIDIQLYYRPNGRNSMLNFDLLRLKPILAQLELEIDIESFLMKWPARFQLFKNVCNFIVAQTVANRRRFSFKANFNIVRDGN